MKIPFIMSLNLSFVKNSNKLRFTMSKHFNVFSNFYKQNELKASYCLNNLNNLHLKYNILELEKGNYWEIREISKSCDVCFWRFVEFFIRKHSIKFNTIWTLLRIWSKRETKIFFCLFSTMMKFIYFIYIQCI